MNDAQKDAVAVWKRYVLGMSCGSAGDPHPQNTQQRPYILYNEAVQPFILFIRLNAIPDLQQVSLAESGNFVYIESSWKVTDPAKHDDSSLSKSWIFDQSTKSVTQLPSRTCSSPKTLIKKSLTTGGLFAQIVELDIGKSKELFLERWNQDQRLNRIALSKTVESVPKDTDISGSLVLSDDGRYCVFAAELKV